MTDNLIPLLENSELFEGFSTQQLQWIVQNIPPTEVTLKNREFLYKRGDIADRCWLIQSGKILVQRPSLRNPYRNVNYEVGSVTGLQGLIEPEDTRPVSLLADGDVKLLEFPCASIAEMDGEARLILYRNINKILLKKVFECRTALSSWEDFR